MSILDHSEMLRDKPRMIAYKKAIESTVKQGDVVCDLGAGSGIMGFLALKAGAKHVYAIEQSEVIEQARKLAIVNGFKECHTAIKGFSTKVELPEKVDLIIVENLTTLGAGAEEMELSDIADACERYLKPGGKIIPEQVDHLVVPVNDEANWNKFVGNFSSDFCGVDFSSIRKIASLKAYKTRSNAGGYLCRPESWLKVDHMDASTHVNSNNFKGHEVRFKIEQEQICHGLAAWFDAQLIEGVSLKNSPDQAETHWQNFYFPVEKPFRVLVEDELVVELGLRSVGREIDFFWNIEHLRDGKKVGHYGSAGFAAQTLEADDLARMSGQFVPLKSEKDACLEAFLPFIDGKRNALEIAKLARQNNPGLWDNFEKAVVDLIELWHKRPLKAENK